MSGTIISAANNSCLSPFIFTLHLVLLFTIHYLLFTLSGSLYFQTPDLARDRRHRHTSRFRRGVAGDLDAVSSLRTCEGSGRHSVAAGNDSAASREARRVDWQRRRQ